MIDPIEKANQAVAVLKQVIDLSAETPELKEAGTELAKSALTVAKAINVVLLPVAAVNFGYAKAKIYFSSKFEEDIVKKLGHLKSGDLVEPKPSIAAPLLQGLAFSHEEEALRDMYLNLLASAMKAETSNSAHPAFVEIIRQMTSKEARVLKDLTTGGDRHAIIRIKVVIAGSGGQIPVWRNLLPYEFFLDNGVTYASGGDSDMPATIDNLARLGLITVHYDRYLTNPSAYDWVESHPIYTSIKTSIVAEEKTIGFDRGYLGITDFGESFAKIVLQHPKPQSKP